MDDRLGRWVRLHWQPTDPILWAGPTWAMLCGVANSAGFRTEATTITRLILTWFLADPILGAVWAGAADIHAAASEGHPGPDDPPAVRLPWLPYTLPDSPGGRLRACLERALGHCRDGSPWGTALGGLILGTALSLLLGIIIGGMALWLTAAGLALAWVGAVSRPTQAGRVRIRLFFPILLSWLLGHAVLSPLSWPSVALAGLYALAIYSYAILPHTDRWQGHVFLASLAQLLIMLLLVLHGQPLLAGIVGSLIWMQLLWQLPLLGRGQHVAYWRLSNLPLLASMMISAWGLAR